MTFDITTLKVGDIAICRDGQEAEYIGRSKIPHFPYTFRIGNNVEFVKYNGKYSTGDPEHSKDIIAKKEPPQDEPAKVEDEVNGMAVYRRVREAISDSCIPNGRNGYDIDLHCATISAIAVTKPTKPESKVAEKEPEFVEGWVQLTKVDPSMALNRPVGWWHRVKLPLAEE
jgi:hypothetical protein